MGTVGDNGLRDGCFASDDTFWGGFSINLFWEKKKMRKEKKTQEREDGWSEEGAVDL